MSSSGLISATVTASAPADNAPTTKHRGHHWFQYGEALPIPAFILLFNTDNPNDTIELPLKSGYAYDFTVDWGDGEIDHITDWAQPEKIHTYVSAGQHTVTIDGRLEAWQYPQTSQAKTEYAIRIEAEGGAPAPQSILHPELLEVQQWGVVGFRYLAGAFRGCTNLTITATDSPDLRTVTSLSFMFHDADVTGNFADWDVSTITSFTSMFFNNPNFNSNISQWNVGSGMFFVDMLAKCPMFDGNLSTWNMSSATRLDLMFWQSGNFSAVGGIGLWDVSNVTNMYGTFLLASSFDSDVSDWQTGNVTNFNGVFYGATLFDSDVSLWDVSNGTIFTQMFKDATSFSTANYDLLLNGWSQQAVNSGMSIEFATQYSASSQAARDVLTNPPNSWVISDNGVV